jgi:hypothetical protein
VCDTPGQVDFFQELTGLLRAFERFKFGPANRTGLQMSVYPVPRDPKHVAAQIIREHFSRPFTFFIHTSSPRSADNRTTAANDAAKQKRAAGTIN